MNKYVRVWTCKFNTLEFVSPLTPSTSTRQHHTQDDLIRAVNLYLSFFNKRQTILSGSGSSHNVRGRQEALCSDGLNLFSEKYDHQKYEVSKI